MGKGRVNHQAEGLEEKTAVPAGPQKVKMPFGARLSVSAFEENRLTTLNIFSAHDGNGYPVHNAPGQSGIIGMHNQFALRRKLDYPDNSGRVRNRFCDIAGHYNFYVLLGGFICIHTPIVTQGN